MSVSVHLSPSRRGATRMAVRGLIAGAAVLLVGTGAEAVPPPERQGPRTVVIDMAQHAFSTKSLSAKAGETVRFVLRNSGDTMHDFTIGTTPRQEGRRALISVLADAGKLDGTKGGNTTLDTPNAVLIMPGEAKVLTWTFTESTNLEFGCNVPGHYEAGMKGTFKIAPANPGTPVRPSIKLAARPSDSPSTAYRPKLAVRDNRADFPAVNKVVQPDAKLALAPPPPFPKEKPPREKSGAVTLITPPALPRSKPLNARSKPATSAPGTHDSKSAAKAARKKKIRPAPQLARTKKGQSCRRTQLPPGSENLIASIYVCP